MSLAVLQTCFGSKYNKHEDNRWAVEHFEDHAELSQADFAMLFSFPVFAALQEYGQDSRPRWWMLAAPEEGTKKG